MLYPQDSGARLAALLVEAQPLDTKVAVQRWRPHLRQLPLHLVDPRQQIPAAVARLPVQLAQLLILRLLGLRGAAPGVAAGLRWRRWRAAIQAKKAPGSIQRGGSGPRGGRGGPPQARPRLGHLGTPRAPRQGAVHGALWRRPGGAAAACLLGKGQLLPGYQELLVELVDQPLSGAREGRGGVPLREGGRRSARSRGQTCHARCHPCPCRTTVARVPDRRCTLVCWKTSSRTRTRRASFVCFVSQRVLGSALISRRSRPLLCILPRAHLDIYLEAPQSPQECPQGCLCSWRRVSLARPRQESRGGARRRTSGSPNPEGLESTNKSQQSASVCSDHPAAPAQRPETGRRRQTALPRRP